MHYYYTFYSDALHDTQGHLKNTIKQSTLNDKKSLLQPGNWIQA